MWPLPRTGSVLPHPLCVIGADRVPLPATGRPSIPVVGEGWPRVHVYAPLRQRIRVKDSGEFDRVDRIRDRRLYAEQLRERASQLVLFGAYQGEIPALIRDGLLTGGTVVWSMWELS